MTLTEAKRLLAKDDMTLTHLDGEYRVNFKHGKEATAYYTNDLADAVYTGQCMRHQQKIK